MLNLYGTLRSVLAGVGGLVWRETKRQEETTLGVPNVGKTGLSVAVLGPKPGQRPLIETFSLQLLIAVTQISEWSVLVNDPPTLFLWATLYPPLAESPGINGGVTGLSGVPAFQRDSCCYR